MKKVNLKVMIRTIEKLTLWNLLSQYILYINSSQQWQVIKFEPLQQKNQGTK
jgi:hypothetical protein